MQRTIYFGKKLEENIDLFRADKPLSYSAAIKKLVWLGITNPSQHDYAACLKAIDTYRSELQALRQVREVVQ